jgi:hypothetical protein
VLGLPCPLGLRGLHRPIASVMAARARDEACLVLRIADIALGAELGGLKLKI